LLVPFQACHLLSPDNCERFLRDVEEQIDSADKEMKQEAEDTLKVIADNYRKLLSEWLEHELGMKDEAEAIGNDSAAQHHRVLA